MCSDATYCGKNCQNKNDDNTAIRCTLCVRLGINLAADHRNDRWHDLFLPIFVNAVKEKADADLYSSVQRESEPVYLDDHGNLVRPVNGFFIALIRTVEQRKEEYLRNEIPLACTSSKLDLRDPEGIATCALEYFDLLLRRHHNLNHLDIRVVAAFAIALAIKHHGHNRDFGMILETLHFDPKDDHSTINDWVAAKHCISTFKAGEIMDAFMEKAHRQYPDTPGLNKLFPLARRLWYATVRKEVVPKELLKDFEHIVPIACLVAAARHLELPIAYEDVCSLTGIDGSLENANAVYGKVLLFSKNSDWMQPPLVRGSALVKAMQAFEMQNEDTESINDALGSLGPE
ncbi:hypothetical protein P280DRAFT_517946 [Massarina eburnea CBS 473.64]|uniref:Uncharacterized protein n=1 Tax=Massarina eburnea CBS 473.64 TaxID=1395130 RepID=A0A6A6S2H4_9PLEO|nr:hypothetical protein P280DRAFT_517946 [Massarina eburnea CBS 473.64]